MGIRLFFALAVLCLWFGACGFDDGEFDRGEEIEGCAEGDDCSDVPTGPIPADGSGDHHTTVIPGSSASSGSASADGDEYHEVEESASEPEAYDLACADDPDICRFCGPPIEVADECPSGDPSFECQVFELVNEYRVDHGQDPLGYDGTLAASAKIHAMDLNHCDYFAHDSLDGSTFFDRCADNGYSGTCTGENIGGGQRTPEDVMEAWIASPGHRHNILYAHHTHVGIAYYEGSGNYGRYWLKHFGRE